MSDITVQLDDTTIEIITNYQWPAWQWIIPKWTYSNITTYAEKESVYYEWSSYICIATTIWNLPTDTNYWEILVSKWDTWLTGDTWPQWIQWDAWPTGDTWTTWDTWIQWIQWDTWPTGDTWPQGIQWDIWEQGIQWDDWEWVIAWWTAWQVLSKIDWTDYNAEWTDVWWWTVEEAPEDWEQYARINAGWEQVVSSWWWLSNLDWWTSSSIYNNIEDIDWGNSL